MELVTFHAPLLGPLAKPNSSLVYLYATDCLHTAGYHQVVHRPSAQPEDQSRAGPKHSTILSAAFTRLPIHPIPEVNISCSILAHPGAFKDKVDIKLESIH